MANFLSKVFSQNQSASFIKSARGVVDAAQALSDELESKTQEELQARLQAVKERTNGTPTSDADIAEVFALVREAARRTLSERHYDVQLMGGLALAKGKIAEMRTGEGKTLTALLPATLRALAGRGVHLVTVNDYLARRDGSWMGQAYAYLGLTVGVITSTGAYVYDATHVQTAEDAERDEEGSFRVFYDYLRPASKQEAYAADITYATNNELGFDYLRDNTAYDKSQITQRGHHYAIIDEVDSILIDEARTPLIISGPAEDAEQLYARFATIALQMNEGEDYTVDEKQKAIQLTSAGITKAEQALNIENLFTVFLRGNSTAELDVHAATGEVRRHRHATLLSGLRNEFSFAFMVLRVQHFVRNTGIAQVIADDFVVLDGNGTDKYRLSFVVKPLDLTCQGAVLAVGGLENEVVVVDAR